MERTGLCMGCHQNMANEAFWAKVNDPGWASNEIHRSVMNQAVRAYAKDRQ